MIKIGLVATVFAWGLDSSGTACRQVEVGDVVMIESKVLTSQMGQTEVTLQPVMGDYAIRPDGTINLGIYGKLHVQGLKSGQLRTAITQHLVNQIKMTANDKIEAVVRIEKSNSR